MEIAFNVSVVYVFIQSPVSSVYLFTVALTVCPFTMRTEYTLNVMSFSYKEFNDMKKCFFLFLLCSSVHILCTIIIYDIINNNNIGEYSVAVLLHLLTTAHHLTKL